MTKPAYPPDPKANPLSQGVRKWKRRRGETAMPHTHYTRNLTERAKENRKNPTAAENRLWFEVLGRRRFGSFKFTRQKPLDKYIVDFYCAELKLAIELDGDSHATQTSYDRRRTKDLNALGIKVVRYTNDDVMHGLGGVFDDLVKVVVERQRVCGGRLRRNPPARFAG